MCLNGQKNMKYSFFLSLTMFTNSNIFTHSRFYVPIFSLSHKKNEAAKPPGEIRNTQEAKEKTVEEGRKIIESLKDM